MAFTFLHSNSHYIHHSNPNPHKTSPQKSPFLTAITMTEIRHEDDTNRLVHAIGKGQHTKRPHPPSMLTLTMACTSLSSHMGGEAGDTSNRARLATTRSPASSENTKLEEDMANCLILLGQGGHNMKGATTSATITSRNIGSNSFKCKTCYRCFPSFQALGGHRTSHKKPKTIATEDSHGRNSDTSFSPASTELSLRIAPPVRVFGNTTTCSLSKPRAHECSICGAKFSTGQALGGHMRRHRQLTSNNAKMTTGSASPSRAVSNGNNVLELDLNLPAPDDRESTTYRFQAKGQQVLVFSASSPLIDCHI